MVGKVHNRCRSSLGVACCPRVGACLNYVSISERLPTAFMPVLPPVYLNGGPREFLSWVIESKDADFRPPTFRLHRLLTKSNSPVRFSQSVERKYLKPSRFSRFTHLRSASKMLCGEPMIAPAEMILFASGRNCHQRRDRES